jgi:hypothetical protein
MASRVLVYGGLTGGVSWKGDISVGDHEPVTDAVPQIRLCWVLGRKVESFGGSVFPVFQSSVMFGIGGMNILSDAGRFPCSRAYAIERWRRGHPSAEHW